MAAEIITNNNSEECENTENAPAAFDKAVAASGFGIFNVLLLIAALPAQFATIFESSTMSYILPIAECDLKLTLINKGTLNAVTYGGMIASAIIWGYLADTKGRKKILAYGFLAVAICAFGSALSQNFEMLVVFKFFGGFIVSGPGVVLFTYVSELHSAKQRALIIMLLGVGVSIGLLVLPLLAWGILPQYWDFVLFGSLKVHSWQIFLLVCAVPSLICGVVFMLFMPESPKFLMSQGRNAEALRVFQLIYAINTRRPRDTYPIKSLVEEVPTRDIIPDAAIYTIEKKPTQKPKRVPRSFLESLRAGMTQIKPMFRKPLLGRSIHCYTMQFCILLGLNTIRLWLPQLFASIAEYEALPMGNRSEESSNICLILEYSVNKTAKNAGHNFDADPSCTASKDISMDMYINNITVAAVGLLGYAFAGVLVRALGPKRMMTLGLFVSGCLGMSLYWSTSGLTTVILSSLFVTVGGISTSSLLSSVVALFPTDMRTLIVSITMMFGRFGAVSGNLLFPVFIELGCIPPFLMVCLVMLCASGLSTLLPNPKKTIFT